jgi:hypothetical protein
MPQHIPDATLWLAELLAANYGRSAEAVVYATGRRAGLTSQDIRHARRELGVEVWGKWWRLPREGSPPSGSTPMPAAMAASISGAHPRPRAGAGGQV